MSSRDKHTACLVCQTPIPADSRQRAYCSVGCYRRVKNASHSTAPSPWSRIEHPDRSDRDAPMRRLRLDLLAARASAGLPLFPLHAEDLTDG